MSSVETDWGLEHAGDDPEGDVAPVARRAPRIAQADVFRAADELLLEGHRPTIDRVRMRLGRGSPNTINDHLDVWWTKLGARLRDVPGHEFPQLPERVAQALQHLWTEALDGARGALQETFLTREQAIAQREQHLEDGTKHLAERESAMAARTGALEESLVLAREQLTAANQRAQALERSVQERDAENARLRSRVEKLEAARAAASAKLDAAALAHQSERSQLQERHASAERHWLLEVDRARQSAKETARAHDQQSKEMRRRLDALVSERDRLRQNLFEARADLKTAVTVREQLEERLRTAQITLERAPKSAGISQRTRRRKKRDGPK